MTQRSLFVQGPQMGRNGELWGYWKKSRITMAYRGIRSKEMAKKPMFSSCNVLEAWLKYCSHDFHEDKGSHERFLNWEFFLSPFSIIILYMLVILLGVLWWGHILTLTLLSQYWFIKFSWVLKVTYYVYLSTVGIEFI